MTKELNQKIDKIQKELETMSDWILNSGDQTSETRRLAMKLYYDKRDELLVLKGLNFNDNPFKQ